MSHETALMQRALQLAERGLYSTWPNPRVGCVLVKNGQIIGEGYHAKAGSPHAEVNALNDARHRGFDPAESDCYVTLEPCAHTGRTPPCTDALITANIKRVICASTDPNPLVNHAGLQRLNAAGIETQIGLLASEAIALNKGYFSKHLHHKPFIIIKVAMSLDGKVAMANGESQWITGPEARADVHLLRARADAIVTGVGTIIADNPRLTARIDIPSGYEPIQQPLRVVLDTTLRIPRESQVIQDNQPTLVMTHHSKTQTLGTACEVINLQQPHPHCDPHEVIAHLAKKQINEVLVEAGPQITSSFIEAQCYDELVFYIAPKIMGNDAHSFHTLHGFCDLNNVLKFEKMEQASVGKDVKIVLHKK